MTKASFEVLLSNAAMTWQEANGVTFLPAPDHLWHRVLISFAARYDALGVPLTFATNAPVLAALAEEVFSDRGALDPQASAIGVRLHAFLHDVPESPSPAAHHALLLWAQGECFFYTVGHSLGFADRTSGFAAAFVTPALVADPLFVQVALLECLGVYLVSRSRRVSLHAAGLWRRLPTGCHIHV